MGYAPRHALGRLNNPTPITAWWTLVRIGNKLMMGELEKPTSDKPTFISVQAWTANLQIQMLPLNKSAPIKGTTFYWKT